MEVEFVKDVAIMVAEVTTASTEADRAAGGIQKNTDKSGGQKGRQQTKLRNATRTSAVYPDKNTEARSAKILSALNIRAEHEGKEQSVMNLLERAQVVGVCETWMRPADTTKCYVFQKCVTTHLAHNNLVGYDVVAVAIHPAIRFQLIRTHAEKRSKSS